MAHTTPKPGQKVLCINTDFDASIAKFGDIPKPELGKVYTVESLSSGRGGLYLEEFTAELQGKRVGFAGHRFAIIPALDFQI